jgi:uncharacterized coiled-coil protein SlyX
VKNQVIEIANQNTQITKLTDIAKNQVTEIANQNTQINRLVDILGEIKTQNQYVYQELGLITEDRIDNRKEQENKLHADTLRLIKLYSEMTYLNSDKGTMAYWPVKKRIDFTKKLTHLLEGELDNTVIKADKKLNDLFLVLYRDLRNDQQRNKNVDPDDPTLSITDSTGGFNVGTQVFQTRINQFFQLQFYLYESMNPDNSIRQ